MVTKLPMFSVRSSAKNANRSPSDAPNFTLMTRPLTSMVSSTAPPLLFTRKPARPPRLAPPAETAISPLMIPATPVGVITNAPSAFLIPCPLTLTSTFARAIRVTFVPFARVLWSKRKSPRSNTPPTVMFVLNTPTRRNGPAGRSSSMVVPATTNISFTAAIVLFT